MPILRADACAIQLAAAALSEGRLAVLPTETVYGLAADATSGEAVARIFEAKQRPSFNPLISHVADLEMAERFAVFEPLARRLAQAFWPGPLTLVLPRRAGGVHDLVTAGLETVAVRSPNNAATRAVIAAVGAPLAMPSANVSGKLSPTSAEAAAESLGERLGSEALILDDGPCPVGVESTILAVTEGRLRLLRPGGLTVEAIEEVAGVKVESAATGKIEAPGQLASHYAPGAGIRLNADRAEGGEAWLGFGPEGGPRQDGPLRRNLSPSGDAAEAAANLFADIRALDQALGGEGRIAVAAIPEQGLGLAIRDRLARAAAPRES